MSSLLVVIMPTLWYRFLVITNKPFSVVAYDRYIPKCFNQQYVCDPLIGVFITDAVQLRCRYVHEQFLKNCLCLIWKLPSFLGRN